MKTVLLYSGGMDSFLAWHLTRPDVALYAGIGHRYEQRELAALGRLDFPVTIDRRLTLGDLELPNAIIPLRNLYLIAIASHYGHRILLGALAGEVNPDKSPEFATALEAVLNIAYGKSYWSEGNPITIEYPLGHLTKAEAVKQFLDQGGDPRALVEMTVSCYSGQEKHCGWCSACIKRYIALKLNGITEAYETDPHRSSYLNTIITRWPTFDAKRRHETITVFPELYSKIKEIP